MIKPNELRLGGLLLFKGEVKEVTGIDPHNKGIYLSDDDGAFSMEQPQPILLTSEWLERCGFKRGKEVGDKKVFYSTGAHKIAIQISGTDHQQYLLDGHLIKGYHPLSFVHQLQNLYFALTGEELTITSPSP
jgi:hypothetical protein